MLVDIKGMCASGAGATTLSVEGLVGRCQFLTAECFSIHAPFDAGSFIARLSIFAGIDLVTIHNAFMVVH